MINCELEDNYGHGRNAAQVLLISDDKFNFGKYISYFSSFIIIKKINFYNSDKERDCGNKIRY